MKVLSPSGEKIVVQGLKVEGTAITGNNPVPVGYKDIFGNLLMPTCVTLAGLGVVPNLPLDLAGHIQDFSLVGETYSLAAATANSVATARYITVNSSGEVACQLPTGAATSANQTTMITALQILDDFPVRSGDPLDRGCPLMGMMDNTATSNATEDRAAFIRITRLRGLHVNLREENGTELFPAPAALADSTSNPTLTKIQAFCMMYNGSNHDLIRGTTLGLFFQGGVSHDSPISSGRPVRTGGRARTSQITPVANDNVTDQVANVNGFSGVTLAHNNRSDTFTTTANGTTIGDGFQTYKHFSLQVDQTGSVTAWEVILEGSLDGTTFTTLLTAVSATDNGKILFSASGVITPVLYFRSRCSVLTLGAGTDVVAKILGVQ